ncbi:MAG: polysaccharide biosynthesis/export family protein [Limisphaerales bacterium]
MKTAFFERRLIGCAVLACAILRWTSCVEAADLADYKIGPLDTIFVDVFGETNLCRECKVQANGEISYPLLGSVKVADQTNVEVEKNLKELLTKDYLVNPQVTVRVTQYRERSITVMGEVNKPGALTIPEEQKWNLVDAIGHAGGFTKLAKKKKIEFTRDGVVKIVDFERLLKDLKDPRKVISLKPGDLITVPQTTF